MSKKSVSVAIAVAALIGAPVAVVAANVVAPEMGEKAAAAGLESIASTETTETATTVVADEAVEAAPAARVAGNQGNHGEGNHGQGNGNQGQGNGNNGNGQGNNGNGNGNGNNGNGNGNNGNNGNGQGNGNGSTPEVTDPEVTDPEVTDPEVTEPEVTEPEVTEPEVTEPEVEADTTAPVLADAAFGPVKGTQTFDLSQIEANPAKAYVEIQQLENGKWAKKSGQWFFDTNDFAFTADTDALADGPATQLKVSTWDDSNNQTSKTYPVVIDRVKPVVTLIAPADGNPVSNASLGIQLDATDDHGLNRLTVNVYQNGVLLKSTSSSAAGAAAATHNATVNLPDGEYVLRYNASDLAGNIAVTGNLPVEIDTVVPMITVKAGATVVNGIYASVPSFKLEDAGVGQIDYVVANGTKHERTNDKWSDLNAGNYAAVQGENTITVFDTAGNSATFSFILDTAAPTITVKDGATVVNGIYTSVPSFKLSDAGVGQVDYVVANGTKYERTNSKWSDLNAGNYNAVQGANTITVFDTAGNSSTFQFVLDTVAPEVTSIAQAYEAKEGGRTAVTLTFSEQVDGATLGQGWYGNGTTFTKIYYREKAITVSFADLVGHTGTYTFTAQAPVAP
ncbi:hypothetical protein [Microbacterium sp. 2FI]|uniref:hypothetical protein n=1 Tax=Microbacterium sp. 2FI TaxID=2502193 RepID=UPI0010F4C27B|nr:hypothetical protein [Microbacterium sp. 2FI]